ncbi:arginine N-succinyltransferase [Paucibacter sp. AS339]|uniref:arginine N-succinyltransferase n=1 Tax=Paucibacter hankyongi TaxID=3133434 RepID=UPI0030A7B69E
MSAQDPIDTGSLLLRGWRQDDAAELLAWRNQAGAPLALPAQGAQQDPSEWLMLVDPLSDRPLACLRLLPRLGLDLPRYSFHLGRVVHAAAELGLFRAQSTLLLGNDHTGESELADMACAPGLDSSTQQALLARLIAAALLRIEAAAGEFGTRLMVELAGPRDQQSLGAAPFWQGLGAHFYAGDPDAALHRLGAAWRSHLAALLPRQTVYLSFLSEAAQAAVGQVGPAGQPAAQALAAAGFGFSQHVSIDDGGPVWELRLPRSSPAGA